MRRSLRQNQQQRLRMLHAQENLQKTIGKNSFTDLRIQKHLLIVGILDNSLQHLLLQAELDLPQVKYIRVLNVTKVVKRI